MKKVIKKKPKAKQRVKTDRTSVNERRAIILLIMDIVLNPHIGEDLAWQMLDAIAENGVRNEHT